MKTKMTGRLLIRSVVVPAVIITFAVCLAFASTAHALTLGPPDIFTYMLTLDYNAATRMLTIADQGASSMFAYSADRITSEAIVGGSFLLSLHVDTVDYGANTATASGGTLTIGGAVPSRGVAAGTLVEATIASFMFDFSGGPAFLFDVLYTSSAPALGFGSSGLLLAGGPALSAGPSDPLFGGNFHADMNFNADTDDAHVNGEAVNGVPEPATLLMLGGGGLLLAIWRGRRKAGTRERQRPGRDFSVRPSDRSQA